MLIICNAPSNPIEIPIAGIVYDHFPPLLNSAEAMKESAKPSDNVVVKANSTTGSDAHSSGVESPANCSSKIPPAIPTTAGLKASKRSRILPLIVCKVIGYQSSGCTAGIASRKFLPPAR